MTSNFAQRIERGGKKHYKQSSVQKKTCDIQLQFTPECNCELNVQHCIHRNDKTNYNL